ncbi:hypothetical protein ACH5RR_018967 [Cinchona calisaya]|uniref:Uncharacterized protein n=1 Tax=Cinchona calisaya TaxID=153742 RepID=A0ABD2ZT55_9GENT
MAEIRSTTVTTEIIAKKPSDQEDQHRQPNNPILGFFSNFLKLFNFPPPPPPPPSPAPAKTKQPEEPTKETASPVVVGELEVQTAKTTVVKFPRPTEENLPSIKLEADEVEEKSTNPVLLWQVYAIGGFLVLRWAWTRWNERRGRKKPSDGNPPPAVE